MQDEDLEGELTLLAEENDKLREDLANSHAHVLEFKEKLADTGAHIKQLTLEKNEADANLRAVRKRVDELESQLTAKNARADAESKKNEETLKSKGQAQKMQLQLYQENEELQNQVCKTTLT